MLYKLQTNTLPFSDQIKMIEIYNNQQLPVYDNKWNANNKLKKFVQKCLVYKVEERVSWKQIHKNISYTRKLLLGNNSLPKHIDYNILLNKFTNG